MATAEMTCKELVELITDYLEGRLPRSERRRFDEHVKQCKYCTTYLDQMRVTIRVLGRLREESIQPAAREELLSAFRDWKREWG
jgi:predicted anti-sigma-YlaC factor YlaD